MPSHSSLFSEVYEIQGIDDMLSVFDLIHNLRDSLSKDDFASLLSTMVPNGYRMFCINFKDRPVCVSGVAVLTNLYYKQHLWVYELVTDPEFRSQGLGEKMLSFLENFARTNSCTCVALSSGVSRIRAHSFYSETVKYEHVSNVYKKLLA